MPKVKMTYFKDFRGRGEVIKLVIIAAKKEKDFEDKRIDFAEWLEMKPNTPFGGLPTVEIDGVSYGQSVAVAAYLAKEYGLYPESYLDQLMVDQIACARDDMIAAEAKLAFPQEDTPEKKEAAKKALNDVYDQTLPTFEKIIRNNPSNSGFAIGTKLGLADIILHEGTQGLSQFQPSTLEKYPCLSALRTKVSESAELKEYLQGRKESFI